MHKNTLRSANMNFGTDLSNEFEKLTRGCIFKEVELFTKLQDAFLNLQNSKYKYAIDIIHGRKSFVNFECNATYAPPINIGNIVTCELADMMFIVFSSKNNSIRLMYLQNKKGTRPDRFKADLLQLNLLKEKRPIISTKLPSCVFGNKNILSEALLPSVASYGVFYNDSTSSKIEMAYYPACNINLANEKGKTKTRTVFYESAKFSSVTLNNELEENQGEKTLSGFGNALVNMQIGTPISQRDNIYHNLTSFLHNISSVFAQSNFPYEPIDNQPQTNISIPFLCIINADMLINPSLFEE